MSKVRFKTVRRRSLSRRAQPSDKDKLRMIKALYVVIYNNDKSLIPLTTEIFHLLGDILEGVKPEELDMHRISKTLFLETFADLSNA